MLTLHNEGVGLLGELGQHEEVVPTEAVHRLPLVAVAVEPRENNVVPGTMRVAKSDGAPAIDLIDGNALCKFLRDLDLGVSTETVEVVKLRQEFVDSI